MGSSVSIHVNSLSLPTNSIEPTTEYLQLFAARNNSISITLSLCECVSVVICLQPLFVLAIIESFFRSRNSSISSQSASTIHTATRKTQLRRTFPNSNFAVPPNVPRMVSAESSKRLNQSNANDSPYFPSATSLFPSDATAGTMP